MIHYVNNAVWEQRKLGEVVDVCSGKDYKHLGEGDIPVYGTGGYMLSVSDALSDQDAIGIGRKGTIDNPYILKAPFWTVDTLFYCVPKDTDLNFVYGLYQTINWRSMDESTGVPSLSKTAINDVDVSVPSMNEQRMIGDAFSRLDAIITLHQCKYYRLKTGDPSSKFDSFPPHNTATWEQRKLLGCIQKITDFRGRTPKKLGMDWSDSGYLALSALNVKDGYIDFSQDVHYGDQALYDKWMTGNELHKGQVLFTTEAPMGNVAQVPDNRQYILSQRTIAFDVQPQLITENFLATILRTPAVFATLTALSSGGTAKGVSQKSLATVDITIPSNLSEQESLASMFSSIDNLITLHQCKYYRLKTGDPSSKFDSFPPHNTATWEQRKWVDTVDISTEMVDPCSGEYDDFPHIAPGNIESFSGRIMDNVKSVKEEHLISGKFRFRPGDVVYGKINPQLGKYFYSTVDGLTSADAYVLNSKNGISQKFLYSVLQTEDFFQYSVSVSKRSGMPKINRDELNAYSFLAPNELEQNLIGTYLLKLDNLITLHQRRSLLLLL